jgi:nucleotide-binding universal stress UspA family protein
MSNVLLLLPPDIETPNAVAYAIQRAKEINGRLVAVAVLDPQMTQRVATTLANIGFVGEKVNEDVVDTLVREQNLQAEQVLKDIEEQARKRGVAFLGMVKEGDSSELCRAIVREHDIAAAVLVVEKRSWLSRFLSRSAPINLSGLGGCEIKIMED